MTIFAVGRTFPVVNSHFVAIFRDLILLHILLILAYFTLLPSLEFSSNADFSNFQSFAWQVIDYLIWIAKYLDRQNSPKTWRTTFVAGWNPDSDLQHRRGAAVLWPPQRDLPEEGEEPQRRVGLGGQHWQLHTVCRGDKFVVELSETRSLGARLLGCGHSGRLWALLVCLITSFTPFGRSGRVTHATVQRWDSALEILLLLLLLLLMF